MWCNDVSRASPIGARPAERRGGSACCGDNNFCNFELRPKIKYYPANPKETFEGAICIIDTCTESTTKLGCFAIAT